MSNFIDTLSSLTETLEQSQANTERLNEIDTRLDNLETQIENIDTGTGPEPGPAYEPVDLLEDDERQTGLNNQAGIRIEPKETINGVSVRISPLTRGISTVYLKYDEGGDVIQTVDVSRKRPGDWVYFDETLGSGKAYEIATDSTNEVGEARNFARGRATDVGYPIEGDAFDVTHGIYSDGGARSESYRYCFDKVVAADFSDREHEFDVLDDVPRNAEIVYGDVELDLEGDVGSELQSFIYGLDDINHAILLPEGRYEWDTHVRVPKSADFFALIGDQSGPHFDIRTNIDHPLTVGSRNTGVGEAVVRNIDWDIRGTTEDGWPVDTGFMQVFAHSFLAVEDCRRLGKRSRYQLRDGKGPITGPDGKGWYDAGNAYGLFCNVLAEDGVGVVRDCYTGGGVHHPVAELPGNHGEGIGFSAEVSEGTIYWRENEARGSVGNTYYLRTGQAEGKNVVEYAEIYNGSRSAIRLGINDEANHNYVEFSDMEGRYPGSGLWFNQWDPTCDDLEIYSSDGNHELVRASSDCSSGEICGLHIVATAGNDHHTVRCSTVSGKATDGILIEDFYIEDRSDGPAPGGDNFSLDISRPDVTLRNGVIDVSNTPREAIGGRFEPSMDNVEIID